MPVLNSTETAIVQAAGDAVLPPSGTILTTLANFFSIRGRTQHMSYPESNTQAQNSAQAIQPLWRANLTSEEYTFVAQNYLPRLYAMLTAPPQSRRQYGDWWDPDTLPNNVNSSNLSQTNVDNRINHALVWHFFWIFFHEDVTRVQETATRIWAYQITVLFADNPSLVARAQNITGGTYVPSPSQLTTGTNGLLLAGAAGLAAFLLLGKPRG